MERACPNLWTGDVGRAYVAYNVDSYPHCGQRVGRFRFNGTLLWSLNTGGNCGSRGGMARAYHTLFFTAQGRGQTGTQTPGYVLAVDAETGHIRWRFSVGTCHESGGVMLNGQPGCGQPLGLRPDFSRAAH
ncbi:MAG: hypothetical protein PVSMB7_08450 [Chloroflexota bacterium]